MIQLGLKIGSRDTQFASEINSLYAKGVFQYIELFSCIDSYNETVSYWKQFKIPFGIHAPHSASGMNLADKKARGTNAKKIDESYKFADALNADYVIFHCGTNGAIEEAVAQLNPFSDERMLLENKPAKGLDGSNCVGYDFASLEFAISELRCGLVLDFGHAVCAANTLKKNPLDFIKHFMDLKPKMFHLTDGDYFSEFDSHLHYGKGSFPLDGFLTFVPNGAKVTNEAKRTRMTLSEVEEDSKWITKTLHKKL